MTQPVQGAATRAGAASAEGADQPRDAGASPVAFRLSDHQRRRAGLLTLLYLAYAVVILLALTLRAPVPESDGVVLDQAWLLASVDEASPTAAPQPVALPYHCPPWTSAQACASVLLIRFDRASLTQAPQALYLPAYSGHLTIRVNGTLLADSTWYQSPLSTKPVAPLLVRLPPPVLQGGENRIELTVEKKATVPAFVGRPYLGAETALRAAYDQTRFLNRTLARLLDGWQAAMAMVFLLLWAVRPQERAHLLFAVMLASASLGSLPAMLVQWPDDLTVRLVNMARFWGVWLILPFACLFVGRRPPVPTAIFLIPPALLYAVALGLSFQQLSAFMRFLFIPASLLSLLVAVLIVCQAAIRDRSDAARLLLGALALTLVLGLHDVLIIYGQLAENRIHVARFVAPLLTAVTGGVLLWRFAYTLNLVDRFNVKLKDSVASAEAALRRSFAREHAQAEAAALAQERMRLMADLHDGIAGQLVSILSLAEMRDRARPDGGISAAARRALTDLRLVVASLEDFGGDLAMMLATFRERIEPQLDAMGVALDWRMHPIPDLCALNPSLTLQLFRLLQEAVVNAARHSGASAVTVEITPAREPGFSVRLVVRDRGCGGAADRSGGHGLASMRRRAAAIGARLRIASDADGTQVVVDLPAHRPTGPAQPQAPAGAQGS